MHPLHSSRAKLHIRLSRPDHTNRSAGWILGVWMLSWLFVSAVPDALAVFRKEDTRPHLRVSSEERSVTPLHIRLAADRSPSYSESTEKQSARTVVSWHAPVPIAEHIRVGSGIGAGGRGYQTSPYTERLEGGERGLLSPSRTVRSKKSSGTSAQAQATPNPYIPRQASSFQSPTRTVRLIKSSDSNGVPTPYQVTRPRQDSGVSVYQTTNPTLAVRFDEPQIARQQTLSPRKARMEDFAAGPPTPVDDTPYIRFAIDQLTRNEEVRASQSTNAKASLPSSVYGGGNGGGGVERIVPDEGLGYVYGAAFTSTAEKEREALALVRKHRSLPAGVRKGFLFGLNKTRPLSLLEGEGEEGRNLVVEEKKKEMVPAMRRKLLDDDIEAGVPADEKMIEGRAYGGKKKMSRATVYGALTCLGVVLVVAAVVFCAVYFTRR